MNSKKSLGYQEIYITLAWLSFLTFLPFLASSSLFSEFGFAFVSVLFVLEIISILTGITSLIMRSRMPKEMRSKTALVLSILGLAGSVLSIGVTGFFTWASYLKIF